MIFSRFPAPPRKCPRQFPEVLQEAQEYIHFVNRGERDVGGVAVGIGGQQAGGEDFLRERIGFVRQVQQFDLSHHVQPLLRHCRFAVGDFVENDLRREKFMLLAFQFPPVAGELLAGGL